MNSLKFNHHLNKPVAANALELGSFLVTPAKHRFQNVVDLCSPGLMRMFFFFIFLLLASGLIASAADIEDCGEIRSYRVAPYLALAVELQLLPKDNAVARLQLWADSHKYDEQVIILCRMLFEPRSAVTFRRPMLGGPGFYGETTMKEWPLEPIAVIDDVPFLIVVGYTLAGHAEEASNYLSYCLSEADWTSRRYHAVSKQEIAAAFERLLKSSAWKHPLSKWELKRIENQIQ